MAQQSASTQAWARGGTVFAATVMVIVGIFQVLEGIVAIIKGGFYTVASNYVYSFNTTNWGWIHLGIGVVVFLTGVALLLTRSMLARVVGICVVAMSAIGNFFFVPYYPFWSLLIIAIDIYVIWSLAHVGSRQSNYLGSYEEYAASRQSVQSGGKWPVGQEPRSGGQTARAPESSSADMQARESTRETAGDEASRGQRPES